MSELQKRAAWVGAVVLIGVLAFGAGRLTSSGAGPHTTAPGGTDAHAHDAPSEWTCSMHPQIRQAEPGSCPICGMDLVPVGDGGDRPRAEVSLSERARALARVRTSSVRRLGGANESVRLLGRTEVDETTLQTVSAWIGGRVDRLHVRVTGSRVRRGQTIATLYSPEVYAAQQDLITARRTLDRLAGASELARSAATAALDAARQRLRLLGIPEAEITRSEAASTPSRRVTIRSPFSGTVLERLASEGTYVQTGAPLYRVADLTRLWVQLDAFESDLPRLTVGQSVQLEVEALPGETLEGRVAFVDPVIDPRRRTARVRIEISDPERRLRPGMSVEAVVSAAAVDDDRQPLVVPASAALFTGQRSVVYVEVPDTERPTYVARVVRLGARVGDHYPVVAGLEEGERVVTQGAFALDADLQIRGGRSMMTHGDDSSPEAQAGVTAMPDAWREGLRPIVERYLEVQEALAEDRREGATTAASALVEAVGAFEPSEPTEMVAAWQPLASRLSEHARRLATATSMGGARAAFESLSAELQALLQTFGNPTEGALRVAHCPMAFDNRGARWVQRREQVDNAYFGTAMRTCGSVQATVAPMQHLAPLGDAP